MFQGLRYDVGMCPYISMVRNPLDFGVRCTVTFRVSQFAPSTLDF